MNIAFHCRNHHLAGLGAHLAATLTLDERGEPSHGLLHCTGTLDHLRQEHLSCAKHLTYAVHSRHKRAFDHLNGRAEHRHCIGQVTLHSVDNALYEHALHTLVGSERRLLAWGFGSNRHVARLYLFGNSHEAFGSIVAAIQQHIVDSLTKFIGDVIDRHDGCCVHDGHVHTLSYCMVQEECVHGLTHAVVATEGERQVAHASAHFGSRQIGLYPLYSPYEIKSVIGMLLNAGSNGEDIGVKDDVTPLEAHLPGKQSVGTVAHFDASLKGIGLTFLVKSHDNHRRTHLLYVTRLLNKALLAFFKTDGVYNRPALHTLQSADDYVPVGRVNHHRHTCHIGLNPYA